MPQIRHRDATTLHERVLDLVHRNEHPDGSVDVEFVESLCEELASIEDRVRRRFIAMEDA